MALLADDLQALVHRPQVSFGGNWIAQPREFEGDQDGKEPGRLIDLLRQPAPFVHELVSLRGTSLDSHHVSQSPDEDELQPRVAGEFREEPPAEGGSLGPAGRPQDERDSEPFEDLELLEAVSPLRRANTRAVSAASALERPSRAR